MKYLVVVSSCLLIAAYVAFQSGWFNSADNAIAADSKPIVENDTAPLRPAGMEPEPEPVVFPSSKVLIMTEAPQDPSEVIFESLLKPGSIFNPQKDSTN